MVVTASIPQAEEEGTDILSFEPELLFSAATQRHRPSVPPTARQATDAATVRTKTTYRRPSSPYPAAARTPHPATPRPQGTSARAGRLLDDDDESFVAVPPAPRVSATSPQPTPLPADRCLVPTLCSFTRSDRSFACKMLLCEARRFQMETLSKRRKELEERKRLWLEGGSRSGTSDDHVSASSPNRYRFFYRRRCAARGFSLLCAQRMRLMLNDVDVLIEDCSPECPDGNLGHVKKEISQLGVWWV